MTQNLIVWEQRGNIMSSWGSDSGCGEGRYRDLEGSFVEKSGRGELNGVVRFFIALLLTELKKIDEW